jgi:hypothetical protein
MERAWHSRLHDELAFAFGFLRLSKAELIEAAKDPELVDGLKAYCEAVRETREALNAAAHFLESADIRIMVGIAALCRQQKRAA